MGIWSRLHLRREGVVIGSGRATGIIYDPREQEILARRCLELSQEKYLKRMDEVLGEGFIRTEVEAGREGQVRHPNSRQERR